MTVNYQPDAFHTVTPYLAAGDAGSLIEFLIKVFDGQVIEKMLRPDGTVNHAEVRVGDSIIMLGQPEDEQDVYLSTLYIYVPDTNETYEQALKAGAKSLMEPMDQYYGDRSTAVKDPSGNSWYIATHFEDIPSDELQRRAAKLANS